MTEKELFQEILKRMSADKELSAILKKMKAGTADFEDMQRYSIRTAEIRAEVLKENLSPAGNGQNEETCIQILKEQHEDVFQKESAVQKVLDEKQNIHIEPKKPKFPAERVRKAAHSLEDKTVSEEVIQRRAENAVANIANTFHDDYIRENAEFRQNAGLKCHVTRTGASKCCAWCAEVAGRYEVGKEPADFWRRHDHCSCRMDYENQKSHQRLSGTGKGWKVDSEVQRRQAQRIEYKPTRLSGEEAKALENEKLSRIKGLTIAGKTAFYGNEPLEKPENTIDKSIENVIIKIDKSLLPEKLAGVRRQNFMSFKEADSKHPNPFFDKKKKDGFFKNCQTAVVAYEARLRGFNVRAKSLVGNKNMKKLAENPSLAWIDPLTKKHPAYLSDFNADTASKFFSFMDKTMKSGERYSFEFHWKNNTGGGHVVCAEKLSNGKIRIYDAQSGDIFSGVSIIPFLLKIDFKRKNSKTGQRTARLLRIDNVKFDIDFVNQILEESK